MSVSWLYYKANFTQFPLLLRRGKSDLPHLSPQCVKQVVFFHHRAKDTVANKHKAIFINNILTYMHSYSFFQ